MNARPLVARLLVALLALAPVAAVFACGNEEQTPDRTRIDAAPPAVEAAAMPVEAAAPGSAAKPETAQGLLPSGDYEITTEVKKDTCAKADGGAAAPDTVTLFVPMKVWRDKSGKQKSAGNFPLPLPRAKGFGSARSDITLEPGEAAGDHPSSVHGMGSQCPAYETKTNYKVLAIGNDTVQVEYTRDFGDASTCPAKAQPPSKCALDYVYTFKLVNKVCDANCGVTFAKGADGGLGPKCQCGDGGAP